MSEQPSITLPAERAAFTNVPDRTGSLVTLEGDAVYDDMVLSVASFIAESSRIPEIAAWLRGRAPDGLHDYCGNGGVYEFYCPGLCAAGSLP